MDSELEQHFDSAWRPQLQSFEQSEAMVKQAVLAATFFKTWIEMGATIYSGSIATTSMHSQDRALSLPLLLQRHETRTHASDICLMSMK